MGQKANPNAMRLGIVRDWNAKYYASTKQEWVQWIGEDKKIRNYLDTFMKTWNTGSVVIERTKSDIKVIIYTSKPGLILGQGGENVAKLELALAKLIKERTKNIKIDVKELANPELNAQVIATEIAVSLENRASFRIAQKKAIRRVMKAGAKGIKTQVSGRLNGVDMARKEGYSHGVVPLQTFRNNIDFASVPAHTTYGVLGVKVWISRGEVLKGEEGKEPEAPKRRPYNDRNSKGPRNPKNSKPAYNRNEGQK